MKYILALLFVAITYAGNCGQTCCQDLKTRAPMTFYYFINTGRFYGGSGDSQINTFGYSGAGKYRNDPTAQCLKNQGPAPANTDQIYIILKILIQQKHAKILCIILQLTDLAHFGQTATTKIECAEEQKL